MNSQTLAALAEINRRFYRRFAADFSASRRRPWPGWDRLVARLVASRPPGRPAEPLAVLDVGCGNGRFAAYLTERWPSGIRYLGVDSCRALLDLAAERLPESNRCSDPRLLRIDLVSDQLDEALGAECFDLIAVFGVLHHLPGLATRRSLLRHLARRLNPAGVLAASVWQHHRRHDFHRRVVPWSRHLEHQPGLALDLEELEDGDTLLTWAGDDQTPRYCHFPGAPEIAGWIADLDLPLADRFEADGRGGRENLYLVFDNLTPGNPP